MKLIAWWIGTDALTLVKNPPANRIWYVKLFFYRIKWKLIKGFFEHWVVHENLKLYLNKFGIEAKVVNYPADYDKKIEKKKHDGFNILYYLPPVANLGGEKYRDWYYGYDIIKVIKRLFDYQDINYIEANLKTGNIDELYKIADIYIRPNKWDGNPRMVQECEIKGIPYYWDPKINNKGILDSNLLDCMKFINEQYSIWKAKNYGCK
jgi:hypothetical protein